MQMAIALSREDNAGSVILVEDDYPPTPSEMASRAAQKRLENLQSKSAAKKSHKEPCRKRVCTDTDDKLCKKANVERPHGRAGLGFGT